MVLLHNDRLFVSNCGDSGAVLAMTGTMTRKETKTAKMMTEDDERHRTNENDGSKGGGGGDCCNCNINGGGCSDRNINGLIAIPLSTDQDPDSLGERERILSSGGYAPPPPQELGLPSRVWLDCGHTQIRLAMSHSIGDHAVKDLGVIARPVVTA